MTAWSLAAAAVVCGLAASWLFRRFTDRAALRTVRKRLQAHLLELRLFADEPVLIWRTQKALFRDNLRFLALMWRPALILAAPFVWLFVELASIYGWSPLALGRAAVVTVQLRGALDPAYARAALQAPPEIAVETPPVRAFAERQISWRIRALRPVQGRLRIVLPGAAVSRSIAAGPWTLTFHTRRERFPLNPEVAWVEVEYPAASVAIAGLSLSWLAWFLLISMLSAALSALWLGAPF